MAPTWPWSCTGPGAGQGTGQCGGRGGERVPCFGSSCPWDSGDTDFTIFSTPVKLLCGDWGCRPLIQSNPCRSLHKVRLIYNEQVITVPGCSLSGRGHSAKGEDLDCDLEEFLQLYEGMADPSIMDRECFDMEGAKDGFSTGVAASASAA